VFRGDEDVGSNTLLSILANLTTMASRSCWVIRTRIIIIIIIHDGNLLENSKGSIGAAPDGLSQALQNKKLLFCVL